MEKSLTIYNLECAKSLIEKANTSQLKEIINKAETLRIYAIQAKKGLEIQNQVAEIKLRAERRIGEKLKEMPKKHGARPADTDSQLVTPLKELGIERMQSSRWQAVASLPEKDFEKHIKDIQKSNEELTTTGVIKLARSLLTENRIKNERTGQVGNLEIRKGDFKKVLADLENIDCIVTDPPYPEKYLECFTDLAKFAAEKLKDDGFIAVYSGHYHLPEVIRRMSEHLTYVWTFCLYHVGKKQLVSGVNIMCGWKPVLIFSKGKKKMRFSAYDVLISEQREKSSHEWQQSESGVKPLIEIFSRPGELVVDPFTGSGTFGIVAQQLGRNFIGAEIK